MTTPAPTNSFGVLATGATIDYQGALAAVSPVTSKTIPVDPETGMLDVWNLPSALTEDDPATHKPAQLWFDTGYKKVSTPQHDYPFDPEEVTGTKTASQSYQIPATASAIMQQYAALSFNDPKAFQALQYQLAQAGFMGDATSPSQIKGGFSVQTEQALSSAMLQYLKVSQGSGVAINFKDYLAQTATANEANGNPALSGSSSSGGTPPTLADPETLALYAQKAAQAALGHNLTTAQVNSFVSSFHEQQTLEAAGKTNGDTVNAADPRAEAINFVTQSDPQGFQQQQVKGYTDAFLDMFTSGQSQAPNINVDPTAVSF